MGCHCSSSGERMQAVGHWRLGCWPMSSLPHSCGLPVRRFRDLNHRRRHHVCDRTVGGILERMNIWPAIPVAMITGVATISTSRILYSWSLGLFAEEMGTATIHQPPHSSISCEPTSCVFIAGCVCVRERMAVWEMHKLQRGGE